MYSAFRQQPQPHLAWHETLEMHEVTAFQSNYLMEFKMNLDDVKDPQLHALYAETIHSLEQHLEELLTFFPKTPKTARKSAGDDLTSFYAAHLLGFTKTAVRNYAIAVTETATPQLREIFQKHLNHFIMLHGKVFRFMHEQGLYPAYQLDQLLANDKKQAEKVIHM